MHKAREVDGRTAPEFVGIVQQLASRAGLPMPKVYIVDSPHPHAFATGRNPENAAVAATTGLLDLLSRHEIAAIGRASCSERVGQYVSISVVAVSLKKKKHRT